jgi:hypothetical protein
MSDLGHKIIAPIPRQLDSVNTIIASCEGALMIALSKGIFLILQRLKMREYLLVNRRLIVVVSGSLVIEPGPENDPKAAEITRRYRSITEKYVLIN